MSSEAYAAVLPLEFAVVGIRVEDAAISGIDFLPADTPAKAAEDPLARKLVEQFHAYLADPQACKLDIPIKVEGTAFQRRVWDALSRIPAGTALTYGELAKQLNTGARAVGNACRRNPVPLIVPCHRVVSSRGLGGFAGDRHAGWTETKRWLLTHEGYTPPG